MYVSNNNNNIRYSYARRDDNAYSSTTDSSNRLNYIITLSSSMTSIALDSGSIYSGGCAFSSENRVVAGKSTLSSFKLLQKNDRPDPLNPGHAFRRRVFHTQYFTHTQTLATTRAKLNSPHFRVWQKIRLFTVYIYIYVYICIYTYSIYGQFV